MQTREKRTAAGIETLGGFVRWHGDGMADAERRMDLWVAIVIENAIYVAANATSSFANHKTGRVHAAKKN